MIIKGLQKLSLIDFAPYTCCVIFTAGCNFRCAFCSNRDLVLNPEKLPTISHEEFYQFLRDNKKWLDGVCVCGGEPTIHKDLPEHIVHMRDLGYKIKLDTNGTNPVMVKHLIDDELLDYIAMDIKSPLHKYESVVQVPVDKDNIAQTVSLLLQNRVDYEFRTTAVPTLINEQDFEEIGLWIAGAQNYFIQQFSNKSCLKRALEQLGPFSLEQLEKFKTIVQPYVKHVEIRV